VVHSSWVVMLLHLTTPLDPCEDFLGTTLLALPMNARAKKEYFLGNDFDWHKDHDSWSFGLYLDHYFHAMHLRISAENSDLNQETQRKVVCGFSLVAWRAANNPSKHSRGGAQGCMACVKKALSNQVDTFLNCESHDNQPKMAVDMNLEAEHHREQMLSFLRRRHSQFS